MSSSARAALLFLAIRVSFASEVAFYIVLRGEESLRYHDVQGSLRTTLGFKQMEDLSPLPAVILLHGLGNAFNSSCNEQIAGALIERGGFNIIAVDYRREVEGPVYEDAARNVDDIGKSVGDFLIRSQKDGSISLQATTLIGFSLGAHVAGVAGYRIKEDHSAYLHKIIGLDPAKPTFVNYPLQNVLDRSDAGCVVVIHTAGGYLGMEQPIGHVDFYPNGGEEIQPLCFGNRLASLICSHQAACMFLADSIAKPNQLAQKCSSWTDFQDGNCHLNEKIAMGFDVDCQNQGTFFLSTSGSHLLGDLKDEYELEGVSENVLAPEDEILASYRFRSSSSHASPLNFLICFLTIFTVCLCTEY